MKVSTVKRILGVVLLAIGIVGFLFGLLGTIIAKGNPVGPMLLVLFGIIIFLSLFTLRIIKLPSQNTDKKIAKQKAEIEKLNVKKSEAEQRHKQNEELNRKVAEQREQKCIDDEEKAKQEIAKKAELVRLQKEKNRLDEELRSLQDETTQEQTRQQAVSQPVKVVVQQVSTPSSPRPKTYHSGLHCPRCKSTNVQLIDTDANVKKVKKSTSINLNPLHPLTVVNHHEKVVKKHSKGKVIAGVMTGGASLLVTGTHDNKSREFHCQYCGNVWKQK